MIRAMLNLECGQGHKHFAPNPLYWIGRECQAFMPLTVEQEVRATKTGKKPKPDKCHSPLHGLGKSASVRRANDQLLGLDKRRAGRG